jgi:3-hydroxyacyl-[acyl-carrier-protein] dehydratase
MSDPLETALCSLPHGTEFRFIDKLTRLEPGKSGAGEYLVRGDEPFLKGHFPGQPIFPGVLLVEAVAQLAGTIAQSDPEIPSLNNLKLTAIRSAKILGTAKPGEVIYYEAEILGRMGALIQATGSASVAGVRVLEVSVVLAGTPHE